jgi:hypothetical protein
MPGSGFDNRDETRRMTSCALKVELCASLCTKVHKLFCKSVPQCAHMCQTVLPLIASLDTNVLLFSTNVTQNNKMCRMMNNCAQICTTVHNCAELCTKVHISRAHVPIATQMSQIVPKIAKLNPPTADSGSSSFSLTA